MECFLLRILQLFHRTFVSQMSEKREIADLIVPYCVNHINLVEGSSNIT
jgi:hypothetical protein